MGLYTACSHGPVHCLWPWACTPLVAMDLYTCGCMQPFGHGPVHCLWPRTRTLLVAAWSFVSMDLYTACGQGPVHCLWLHAALWPWTCILLVAMDLYTACVHGPVHCLWLHAALCPRTRTLLVAACSQPVVDLALWLYIWTYTLLAATAGPPSHVIRPSVPVSFSVLTATQLEMRMAPARECYFPKPEQGPYSASKSSISASPLFRPC